VREGRRVGFNSGSLLLFLSQSKEEQQYLRHYSSHTQLEIFSDPARIDAIVQQIETCLHQTPDH